VREVVDYRSQEHPLPVLKQIQALGYLQVWREGNARERLEGQDRTGLQPVSTLAIWTTPPGPSELKAALERANPQRIYLFAVDPEAESPEAFLRQLAGMVKYAINNTGGQASLAAMAAACAQRKAAIHKGLAWMAARGMVQVSYQDEDIIHLSSSKSGASAEADLLFAQIRAILEETAAYRAFFRRAAPELLT
jgi:hypothetical protein